MNPTSVKSLVQVKDNGTDKAKWEATVLVDMDYLERVIINAKAHPDKRGQITVALPAINGKLTLEIYQPKEYKNLEYTRNLRRKGWETLSVATL